MVGEPRRETALVRASGEAIELAQLDSRHDFSEKPYLEFLRAPSLSVGLYELSVGYQDTQRPHTEDEVYYVLEGRARLRVDKEDLAAEAGTVVFVEAGVEHRFHYIEEDIRVLVFFAPAEYARASDSLESTIRYTAGKGGDSE